MSGPGLGEHRTFVLSPADCGGTRALRLLARLRSAPDTELSLADGFREISALYFRGKIEYARRFARHRPGQVPVWVITPTRGLRPATDPLDADLLEEFGSQPIREDAPAYREPLDVSLSRLHEAMSESDFVVFLGSLATRKYTTALEVLTHRVGAPTSFAGLGNMQRGSQLLQCVRDGTELAYRPLAELA